MQTDFIDLLSILISWKLYLHFLIFLETNNKPKSSSNKQEGDSLYYNR